MSKARPLAVIYDLDSTVAHTRHRWHLSPMTDPESTWDIYSGACYGDDVLPGTATRMRMDWVHYQVHICSGRSISSRDETVRWFKDKVGPWYDAMYLRPEGDRRGNGKIKVDYIRTLQAKGIEVVLFYEDYPEVARQIYAETGVPVVGINPFYEEDDHKREGAPQLGRSDGLGGGL